VSVPWVKTPQYKGTASAITATTIQLNGAFSSTFASGMSYYVESDLGHRVEINETASTGSTLVIDAASPLNTNGSIMPPIGTGLIRVREHWTVDEIFDRSRFVGGGTSSNAVLPNPPPDRFEGWNSTTNAMVIYWHLKTATLNRWVRNGSYDDLGLVAIPPGVGFWCRPGIAMTAPFRTHGLVRNHAFRQNIPLNASIGSLGFPLAASFVSNNMTNGQPAFVATNNSTTSDNVYVWKGDFTAGASGYDIYFYSNVPSRFWTDSANAGLPNYNASSVFLPGRGFYYIMMTAKLNHVVICPWCP
jgi:hypothetical protein